MGRGRHDACTRREFLARSGVAGWAWAGSRMANATAQENSHESGQQEVPGDNHVEALQAAFSSPPEAAKPMTRWWWFGGAITAEEITRELTLMRAAGLRGVEVQPVYPLEVDNPQRGVRNVRYFSQEWFDRLRHTAKETERLGLQCDLTLGSGWPYGGPFIPVELAARRLRLLCLDVVGPRDFSWDFRPQVVGEENVVAILAVPILVSQQPDISKSRVIVSRLATASAGNVRSGLKMENWKVPEGHWKIMAILDCPTGQQVKRPTLGMEGYVLDHFNRNATQLFLRAAGTRVLDELQDAGCPPFHSVFCDSLEVYGADWTTDLPQEFQRRRGYDITPYLPALWYEAGPVTPHIRYDFHLTVSDLLLDHFFGPLAQWSEKNGMKARVQAHGAMGDVMQGYAAAHIPEGETIFFGDSYAVNIRHRRLASSAGHIYQKPVISSETYTWLRMPLFLVTLEMMKAATDAQFLEGMNQIVNHGYPSSPAQAGQPGWVFYASTAINHNNVWWRHYPYLARYIQRAASLLQMGSAVNPVAVYLPLADIYAKFGAGGLNMDVEIENQLGTEWFQELRRAGYDFDLINDHALARLAKVAAGELRAGDGAYSVAVVPGAQYMPPESLDRLAEFVRSGGTLIFMNRIPAAAPGLAEQESRTARLRATLDQMWEGKQPVPGRPETFGKGNVILAADGLSALNYVRSALNPDFRILEAGDGSDTAQEFARDKVGFLHRRIGKVDFYFVSNVSDRRQDLRVQFALGHKSPQRWHPETGETETTVVFEYVALPDGKGKVTEVQFRLEPFESCFLVFSPSGPRPLVTRTNWLGPLRMETVKNRVQVAGLLPRNGDYYLASGKKKTHRFSLGGMPEPVSITGPWDLALGGASPITLKDLPSWTDLPEGKGYSGWAKYETTFELADLGKDIEWRLDLGRVHETAEVVLNGVPLGAAWKGRRTLSCKGALNVGQNSLRVEVGNLWIHKVRTLSKPDLKPLAETYGIRWGTYGEVEPKSIPASGLLGPVWLVPLKRWMVRF